MKKSLTLILFVLQYTTVTVCKEVHVVPLYQERLTGRWCGLFARDAGGLWSTFKQTMADGTDALTCALRALKEQTNGVYSLDKQSMQKVCAEITLNNGDVVCCLPVKHMTIPLLQRKMVSSVEQDTKKDNYIWLPMEDLLAHTTIVRMARNLMLQYKFDGATKALFKNHWLSFLQPHLNASVNREKALALAAKKARPKVACTTTKVVKPAAKLVKVEKQPILNTAQRHNRFTTKALHVATRKPMTNYNV